MFKSPKEAIEQDVSKIREMETKLVVLQNSLSKNKEFQEFIKLQNAVNDKAKSVWSDVERKMIENEVDSIDLEWVKLTIVKSSTLEYVGVIAPKFTKRVPDTKKINDHIKKHGVAPEGVNKVPNPYLRKTFRDFVS